MPAPSASAGLSFICFNLLTIVEGAPSYVTVASAPQIIAGQTSPLVVTVASVLEHQFSGAAVGAAPPSAVLAAPVPQNQLPGFLSTATGTPFTVAATTPVVATEVVVLRAPATATAAIAAAVPAQHTTGAAPPSAESLAAAPSLIRDVSAAGPSFGGGSGTTIGSSVGTLSAVTATSAGSTGIPNEVSAGGAIGGLSMGWRVWPQLQQVLLGITFTTAIKAACMAGNVLVQVSPYPQVKRWASRGCTGESDPAPYVSIAFGGWQWCYYGIFAWFLTRRSGFLILVQSNCLGALLGTFYVLTFYKNCRHERIAQCLQKYLSAVTTLVLLQVCTILTLPPERALFVTGLIASFCSFVGALSMLVSVPAVISMQDSRIISGPLVLANFFSALVWVICGWLLTDPLIATPNVVSVGASGFCLYLKFRYPSDGAEDEDDVLPNPTGVEECPEVKVRQKLMLGPKRFDEPEYNTFAKATTFSDDTGGTWGSDC